MFNHYQCFMMVERIYPRAILTIKFCQIISGFFCCMLFLLDIFFIGCRSTTAFSFPILPTSPATRATFSEALTWKMGSLLDGADDLLQHAPVSLGKWCAHPMLCWSSKVLRRISVEKEGDTFIDVLKIFNPSFENYEPDSDRQC